MNNQKQSGSNRKMIVGVGLIILVGALIWIGTGSDDKGPLAASPAALRVEPNAAPPVATAPAVAPGPAEAVVDAGGLKVPPAAVTAAPGAPAAVPPAAGTPGAGTSLSHQVNAATRLPTADLALRASIARRHKVVPPEVDELMRRRQAGASVDELNAWLAEHPIKEIGVRVAVLRWLNEIARGR